VKRLAQKLRWEERKAEIVPQVKKWMESFLEECSKAQGKLKNLPETNYRLGLYHMKQGNLSDAIMRFKMVTSLLAPNRADAYYNLGRCLALKGEKGAAIEALRKAISLDKKIPEAHYILAKLEHPETITATSPAIIREMDFSSHPSEA